jgi:hypothetical protein
LIVTSTETAWWAGINSLGQIVSPRSANGTDALWGPVVTVTFSILPPPVGRPIAARAFASEPRLTREDETTTAPAASAATTSSTTPATMYGPRRECRPGIGEPFGALLLLPRFIRPPGGDLT